MRSSTTLLATLCCLVFIAVALPYGLRLAKTEIQNYDGLLFHSDTAEVADDMTTLHTPRHADTNVHPLFVLLVNPPGVLLGKLLPAPYAVLSVTLACGILLTAAAFFCFAGLGFSPGRAALWTILAGTAACHLLFATIPERHIMASLSVALVCLVAIRSPGRLSRFIIPGILALGITITNVAQCFILFLATRFTRDRNKRSALLSTAGLVAVIILASVLLSIIQHAIWPHARYFFMPGVYGEESAFFLVPTDAGMFLRKLGSLLSHMGFFNIVAPSPLIGSETLTFDLRSWTQYPAVGILALAGWATMAAVSLCIGFRRDSRWLALRTGILLCLLCNLCIHMIYGDDFFIYSANWTLPMILLVAAPLSGNALSPVLRRITDLILGLLVMTIILTNMIFMGDVTGHLEGRGSDKWKQWQPDLWHTANALRELAQENDITVFYGDPEDRWISYATDDAIKVVDIVAEPSRNVRVASELALCSYGFLGKQGGALKYIRQTGGRYDSTRIRHLRVAYNIHPPDEMTAVIRPEQVADSNASSDSTNSIHVTDLNIATAWSPCTGDGREDWLELRFTSPVDLGGLRLFAHGASYPKTWRIDVMPPGTAEWTPVTGELLNPHYFWSGPRLYWSGQQFSLAATFPPTEAIAVRIGFPDSGRHLEIAEVLVYGAANDRPKPKPLVHELSQLIREHGIDRLYAERWICNEITRVFGDRVQTATEKHIFTSDLVRRSDRPDLRPSPVTLTSHTAILVRACYAPTVQRCLQKAEIPMQPTTLAGSWVFFRPRAADWNQELHGYSRLVWAGTTCFLTHSNWATKHKAAELTRLGMDATRDQATRLRLLRSALAHYPDFQQALAGLQSLLEDQDDPEATVLSQKLTALREPQTRTNARFGNSAELIGLTLPVTSVHPGESIPFQLYWRCGEDFNHHGYAVFMHFRRDGKERLFQGDHVFCGTHAPAELAFQPFDEIFREDMIQTIPAETPVGNYEIFLGICNRTTGKRMHLKSSLPSHRNAVILPVKLTVKKASGARH